MTVNSTARKEYFTLDQSEAHFDFTFRALTSAPIDIKCLAQTGSTTKTLAYITDYTVAVDADGVGGRVTLVSPATLSKGTLTVYRETTNTQGSDYEDYNQFPANTVETDFDRRTLVDQEQSEAMDRSIKLAITNTLTGLVLPDPSDGKTLKWSVSGSTVSMINSTVDIDTAIAQALASQAAALVSETAAASSATVALGSQAAAAASATTASSHATTAVTQATIAASEATTAIAQVVLASSNSTTALTASTTASSHATTALSAQSIASSVSTTAVSVSTTAVSVSTTAVTSSTAASSHATTSLNSAAEAVATLKVALNNQTGNYTLAVADVNKMVTLNSAGTITLTVPLNSVIAIPTGSVIGITQIGAGKVTITPTNGSVTVNKEIGLNTAGSYATCALLKTGTDEWLAVGSLEA